MQFSGREERLRPCREALRLKVRREPDHANVTRLKGGHYSLYMPPFHPRMDKGGRSIISQSDESLSEIHLIVTGIFPPAINWAPPGARNVVE